MGEVLLRSSKARHNLEFKCSIWLFVRSNSDVAELDNSTAQWDLGVLMAKSMVLYV